MITTVAGTYDTETILRAADQVQGWMSVPELVWLIEQARTRHEIVEVGAFVGRSTLALALATPGRVVSVDTWRGEPQDYPDLTGNMLHGTWIGNLSRQLAMGKATHFTGTLAEYAATMPAPPDFLFIDGAHDPASVIADCRVAKQLAAKGATIAGHDLPHPGLEDAVRSVFPRITCPVDRIWQVAP